MPDFAEFDFAFVYEFARYVASFFVYSFAGWLFEVVISLFQHHRFVNRGFSFGPVCPIYGVGALVAVLFLSRLGDALTQFVVGFFAAGVLEFGTSWAMEKLFHARWWDYSNIPLNVNGRICVPGLLLFSSLMLCVNLFAQPTLDAAFARVPAHVLVVATMVVSLVFVADLTASVIRMQGLLEKLRGVQSSLSGLSARAREAVRNVAPDVRGIAGGMVENLRQLVDPGVLDEIQSKLKDAVQGAWSRYERKSMRDPRFKLTQYSEAFEWLRNVVPYVRREKEGSGEEPAPQDGKDRQDGGAGSVGDASHDMPAR